MKKLIDELKKLDEEYVVSEDFSRKIIAKIKTNEKKQKVGNFYRKMYMLAPVAAVVVVCILFSDLNSPKNMDSINSGSRSFNAEEKLTQSNNMLSAYQIDEIDQSAISESAASGKLEDNSIEMYEDKNIRTNAIYNKGDTPNESIEMMLANNGILILEKNSGDIIVEANERDIKEILEGYEYEIETLEDNKVKIILLK